MPPVGALGHDRALAEATVQLGALVHGGRPRDLKAGIPVPVMCRQDGHDRPVARLLRLDPTRRYNLDRLVLETKDWTEPFVKSTPPEGARGRSRAPLALRMRTLPEGWGLGDLDLPAALVRILREGGPLRDLRNRYAPYLAREMAARRYGLPDVLLVLNDRRYAFARAAPESVWESLDLGSTFQRSLQGVRRSLPPRLPFGVRRLTLVRGQGEEGGIRRVRVEGGSRLLPFAIDVRLDVLWSARQFARALLRQTGRLPEPVPPSIWTSALRVALKDRRISRVVPPRAPEAPHPLSGAIRAFARRAAPWPPAGTEGAEAPSPIWPVRHGEMVLFPLPDLRRHLEDGGPGDPPSLGEVTAAVRDLGGDVHGCVRFGARFIRCWVLPASAARPQTRPDAVVVREKRHNAGKRHAPSSGAGGSTGNAL